EPSLSDVGFIAAPPSGLWVDDIGERIHHGVDIGANPKTVDPRVIAGVDDDGRMIAGRGNAIGQAGSAATAGQYRHTRAVGRPVHSRYGSAAQVNTADQPSTRPALPAGDGHCKLEHGPPGRVARRHFPPLGTVDLSPN